jgi:hypothetical protein
MRILSLRILSLAVALLGIFIIILPAISSTTFFGIESPVIDVAWPCYVLGALIVICGIAAALTIQEKD